MHSTGSSFGNSMTSSGLRLRMKLAEWRKNKVVDASAGKTRISEDILALWSHKIFFRENGGGVGFSLFNMSILYT